ncbi:hypothetical protein NDU88_009818 [Pleurodeles waltl]|uniref:protein-tyrosine-phosphatase n=1 Tax=Pleurodeles waltl TaxID=8319 RepID=A0AAV7PW15_PLEWA|nr:hypothetical protein NDU88_009818 [Pleurodeles waltl]
MTFVSTGTTQSSENTTATFATEASTAIPTTVPPQIDCKSLNWMIEENRISVQRTNMFNRGTAAAEDYITSRDIVDVSTSGNISITALEPGCRYNVSLYSSSYEVCSILLYTRPAPVSIINVSGVTTDSLNVTLNPPNGTCVDTYTYNVSVSGGAAKFYSNRSVAVTGLQPGQSYTITVYSLTPTPVQSSQKDFVIGTQPSPVSNFTIASRNETSLTLQWTVPRDQNQSSYKYMVVVGSLKNVTVPSKVSGGDKQTEVIPDLKPGVSNNLSIYSITANDFRSVAVTINDATTMPSPDIDFTVIHKNETSLILGWQVPNDINRASYIYQVTVSLMGIVQKSINFSNPSGGEAQTETVGNLAPGVQYELSLYSVTPNGIKSNGISITGANATTMPSPVNNFTVANKNETSLTLQWTAPSDTGRANYSYQVTVSVSGIVQSSINFSNLSGADVQTGTIGSLAPGVPYELSIYSVTPNGVKSNAVSITGANATTMPSPVINFIVANKNETSLTLEWTAPSDSGRANYSYQVTVSVSGKVQSSTNFSNPSGGDVKRGTIGSLAPGVPYELSIYSITPNGVKSNAVSITGANATTVPSPVINFIVANKNETSLTLEWTAPSDSGRANYSYQVTVSVSGKVQSSTNFSNPSGGDVKRGTIGSLAPGVSYELSIYSITPNGVKSNAVSITGANATTVPSPVINFTVANKNETSLTLQWTAPSDSGKANYSYQVTVSVSGKVQSSTNFSNPSGGDVKRGTIGSLAPGVPYELSIYSITPNGVKSNAVSITGANATTVPSPVINFNVAIKNETSLTLQWTVPNDSNRANYSYQVMVSLSGIIQNSSMFSNPSGGDVQTGTIGNLAPGVPYELSISSVTLNGVKSNRITITGANATTMPSPVINFIVANKNETFLSLQWTAPNDIYRANYSYQVMVSLSGNIQNSSIFSNPSGDVQTGIIGNLAPGVPYELNISSITLNGVKSNGKTITGANATTNPSPVSNVNLHNRTNSSITISWTKPDNLFVNSYTYWVKVQNAGSTIGPMEVKENVSTQNSLLPGTLYTFVIQSVTENNVSSTETNYRSYSNPNQPENLMASPVSDTVILIDWTAPKDPNADRYQYNMTLTNAKHEQTTQTASTNATNRTFEALYPGNLYIARVTSWIDNAFSTESQTNAQTNPQTVRTFSDVSVTNTTALLSWDINLLSISDLSGFLITTTSDTNDSKNTTLGPSLRNYTIGDLTPGMNYTFEFRSFTNSTFIPAAASGSRRRRETGSSITTYSPAVTKRAQTVPGTTIGVNCKIVSGGYSLGVTWTCPTGSFDGIQVLLNNEVKSLTKTCNKEGSVTVAGLQPASKYGVIVQTIAGPKLANSEVVLCETDPTGVIVGAIFGVLLFLVLIGLIIFLVLKYRRTKESSPSGRSVNLTRFPPDISVDGFPSHFRRQHSDSDFGFAEDYQLLSPIGTDQLQSAAKQEENRPKNRYTNVLPYDNSRVKLRCLPGDPCSDYINANYMPGYNSSKEFIATQGPLPSTIGDFWRMVWEHRVGTMVMLTNCTEGGKLKCEHYWPLDYTPCTYGDITVTVTSEIILPQWTTREFTLKHAKEPGIRYASHFHYTVWPDHGVPDETATVIKFRNIVREHMDQRRSNGPAVVHCSAGVGRTGTLIALDYLMQQVKNENKVGVFSFIKKMRLNRPFMVQTESQYVFLNQCMLDVIQNPHVPAENIYENQMGGDLIYENVGAGQHYGNGNGRLA